MDEPRSASMKDAFDKIPTLSRYEAGFAGSNYTTRFMRYVADPASNYFREGDAVYAETYLMTIFTALNDAASGKNSMGGMPPERMLAGFPAQMYVFVQRDIPEVAQLLFPAEFAAEVSEAYMALRSMFPVQRRAG